MADESFGGQCALFSQALKMAHTQRSGIGIDMEDRTEQSTRTPRAIALVLWLALVEAWLLRHVGSGVEDLAKLLGAPVLLATATGLLDFLLSERDGEAVREQVRGWLRRRTMSTPFIVALYAVTLPFAFTLSSVNIASGLDRQRVTLVVGDGPQERSQQQSPEQSPEQSQELSQELRYSGESLRRLVWVHPFGSPLELRVEGFVPYRETIYPISGVRLQVERDLTTGTTLLLRGVGVFQTLADGGRMRVLHRTSGADCLSVIAEGTGTASKRLGSPRDVPDAYLRLWELELRGHSHAESTVARMLLAWALPENLELSGAGSVALEPGNELFVEALNVSGCRLASRAILVDAVPFRDHAIGEKDELDAKDLRYCPGARLHPRCGQD